MTSTLLARGYIVAVLVAVAVLGAILLIMHGLPVHAPSFSASDATGTVKWKP